MQQNDIGWHAEPARLGIHAVEKFHIERSTEEPENARQDSIERQCLGCACGLTVVSEDIFTQEHGRQAWDESKARIIRRIVPKGERKLWVARFPQEQLGVCVRAVVRKVAGRIASHRRAAVVALTANVPLLDDEGTWPINGSA